ncbi:MAG TPA: hypoxanthine-guanine phosphoribosyltransferase [Burkholderiales bacterium]|nr:hypoxanthine-guanine phosphoribosyltransferase [Burkholderiales bacterium]
MPELSPNPGAAWEFLKNSDEIASAAQVQAAIDRVAAEIQARLADAYPLVLAVMGGAVVFAGQILPKLRFPIDFDYIHATRYGAATRGAEIQWRVTPPKDVAGRTVLVLDDILDGGDTMAAIRDRLLGSGARAFFSAVLVEKVLDRKKPIAADFIGLKIADRFVFGCGMDAKGYWRNLPEIRAMKGS